MLIACPSCQRQLNVPDNAAGKQVRCPAPDCGTIFTVSPQPTPAAKASPARPVPAPAAPRPQPAAGAAPFEFGGGVVGPEADFGFTERDDGGLKGIGLRTRVNRAAGWLNTSAGSMVVYTLFFVSLIATLSAMNRQWYGLIGAGCVPFILLPIPVIIIIGARMLARARRWGFALTAAIFSLGIGVLASILVLVALVLLVLNLIASAAAVGNPTVLLVSCGNLTLLATMAFFGTFGGFVALRTLMNAEIKKTFT